MDTLQSKAALDDPRLIQGKGTSLNNSLEDLKRTITFGDKF